MPELNTDSPTTIEVENPFKDRYGDGTFEAELALVVTKNGRPWYSNVSNYENLPLVAVLAIEDKIYKALGELLEMGKDVAGEAGEIARSLEAPKSTK